MDEIPPAATQELQAVAAEPVVQANAVQLPGIRVTHLHGLNLSLDPNAKLGFGKNMCVGTLAILADGIAFQTEQSQDRRSESVRLSISDITQVGLKKDGRQLVLFTSQGKFDFVGDPTELDGVARFLLGGAP